MSSNLGRRLLLIACFAGSPLAASDAAEVPVSPAAAERLLEQSMEVTSEFRQIIERARDSGSENLATLADTGSPDWRLYYRDRQMLFAVPSRQNLTAAQKKFGEQEAARMASVMLQQRFSQLLKLEKNTGLEPGSVRVVFIEPAAFRPAGRSWDRYGPGTVGPHVGFAGVPLPFAPSGIWPGSGYQGGCGCH